MRLGSGNVKEEEKMNVNLQQNLFDTLVSFGINHKVQPKQFMDWLIDFIAILFNENADEEDVRYICYLLYRQSMHVINEQKKLKEKSVDNG